MWLVITKNLDVLVEMGNHLTAGYIILNRKEVLWIFFFGRK